MVQISVQWNGDFFGIGSMGDESEHQRLKSNRDYGKFMSILEQLKDYGNSQSILKQGAKARIKHTGQIVELKSVSQYGISLVEFRAGDEYFVSNKFLEPVFVFH